jgi:hypothetical protein
MSTERQKAHNNKLDRNELVIRAYKTGLTLQEVAKTFGMSRQRIHQIVVNEVPANVLSRHLQDRVKKRHERAVLRREAALIKKFGSLAKAEEHKQKWVAFKAGKRWSFESLICLKCGRNDRPHQGRGYCERCYGMMRYHNPLTKDAYRAAVKRSYLKKRNDPVRWAEQLERNRIYHKKSYLKNKAKNYEKKNLVPPVVPPDTTV